MHRPACTTSSSMDMAMDLFGRFRPCRTLGAYLIGVVVIMSTCWKGCEAWTALPNNPALSSTITASFMSSKKTATRLFGASPYHEEPQHPPADQAAVRGAIAGRRAFVVASSATLFNVAAVVATPPAPPVYAAEQVTASTMVELVPPTPDIRKLFNDARAYESQGNLLAAQKLYQKITVVAPRFLFGWSNLGNMQTAYGDLTSAEQSYTTAINLCDADAANSGATAMTTTQKSSSSVPPSVCAADYYLLRLNRGTLRINNGRAKEGLADLQLSALLRGRPDAVVLQNLARAEELNGLYREADRDYTTAIEMSANAVVPFWLRSVLVKYQLGDIKGGYDILKRVENKFPQAPEVQAASAVYLWRTRTDDDDTSAARQKFLLIPDRARLKYIDPEYVKNTINWPPAMVQTLREITRAVGDSSASS
jgi:tetratricopeptide (TPR) repeat protein